MKSFSVIEILGTFTPEEIKDFDRFVKVPYFGGSEFVAKFWKEIKKAYPEFSEKLINKERIFKKLYPGKAYSDATIRKLSSELLKICEEFIKISELRKGKTGERMLLFSYRNRQLFKQYDVKWKEIQEHYKKESEFNFINLIERHLLQIPNIQIKSDKKKDGDVYKERMKYYEHMIAYILSILMQEQTRAFQNKQVFNHYDGNIADDLFKFIDMEGFLKRVDEDYPEFKGLLMFNYNIMKAFELENGNEYFEEAKKIIFKNAGKIPPKALYFYCSILINYLLKVKMGISNQFANKRIIEIVEMLIKRNAAIEPSVNIFNSTLFNVAIEAYNELGEISKSEKFVKKFADSLSPDIREAVVMIAQYYILLAKKEFEKALEMLAVMDHVDPYNKLNFRRDKLVIFYELGMINEAFSLVHSMRQFVKENDTVSKEERERAKLFVNYYRKLLDAKDKNDNGKLEDLQFLLNKEPVEFIYKDWLKEKAKENKKARI